MKKGERPVEKVLQDRRLYQFLEKADADRAEAMRLDGCRRCGSRLHRADYERKPRGGPGEFMDRWDKRHSFCCEKEGCRKRHTPSSVRFLGRKVYAGVVVVLVAAMMHGPNVRRVTQLREALGIDMRTLRHWRQWWLELFVGTPFWKAQRSRFMPVLDETVMPVCLVAAFGADNRAGLIKLMEFISPITTNSGKEAVAM
jgi:hypothetical protein